MGYPVGNAVRKRMRVPFLWGSCMYRGTKIGIRTTSAIADEAGVVARWPVCRLGLSLDSPLQAYSFSHLHDLADE